MQGREISALPRLSDGGWADVSRYNDGLRGGAVKVRAKISKIDKRTLAITEIPYTTTTESIKDSIIKANDKGKIKIRKVDDNTADKSRSSFRSLPTNRRTRPSTPCTPSPTARCRSLRTRA